MSYEVVLPKKYESSYPSKIQNEINNGQKNKIKGKPCQIYYFICDVYSFRNMVQAKYTIFFKLNILFLKLFTDLIVRNFTLDLRKFRRDPLLSN